MNNITATINKLNKDTDIAADGISKFSNKADQVSDSLKQLEKTIKGS